MVSQHLMCRTRQWYHLSESTIRHGRGVGHASYLGVHELQSAELQTYSRVQRVKTVKFLSVLRLRASVATVVQVMSMVACAGRDFYLFIYLFGGA